MNSSKSRNVLKKMNLSLCKYTDNDDFEVVFKGSNKVLVDNDEIADYLMKTVKLSHSEIVLVIQDILITLSKECVHKEEEGGGINVDIISATPSDKAFFNKLKFTTDKGNKIWMVRTNKKNFEVVVLESKLTDISFSYGSVLSKYGLYNKYKRKYESICGTDPYRLCIVENIIDRGSENQTSFTAPNFDEYLSKTLKIIGSDESMFVDNLPVSISNNKDIPCFYYFDTSSVVQGEWGLWKQFINRFPNDGFKKVFMEWIYMIFLEGIVCEQKMYIRGEGGDGKSTIINVIFKKMGHACYIVQSGSLKGNHWGAKVYDKRLVIHSDSKNPRPLDNEKSHLATDIIDVEKKYEAGFSHKANYMELFMSNDIPEINDVDNERRRLLYIPLNKLDEKQLKTFCKLDEDGNIIYDSDGRPSILGNTDYEKRLEAQFDAFLYECKLVYEENNNGANNNVYVPDDVATIMYEEIINDASEFEFVVNNLISATTTGHIKSHDLKLLYDYSLSNELKSYQSFTRQLKLKFPKMVKKSKRINGKVIKVWRGIEFDSSLTDEMDLGNTERIDEIRSKLMFKNRKNNKSKRDFSDITV